MKTLVYSFILSLIILLNIQQVAAFQSTSDTLQFEDQRQRVNKLLNERSEKFGEYNVSLDQKTGIFGLFKTHKDMQKSIDILRAVVLNDNNIFIETRKLLDLKDGEKERFQQMANEYDTQITAHMRTISKLQAENDKLSDRVKDLEKMDDKSNFILYLLGMLFLALAIGAVYYFKKQQVQKN